MEKNLQFCGITYILVLFSLGNAAWITAKPQSSAPTPATDCSQLIFDMLDCMSFLNNGPSDPKPSSSCCTGFETVLDTDAECVCEGFKNAASMGLSVNITKAATLPSLCHVSAPPISTCNISIAPTPSTPIPSPSTPSPGTSPATPPTNNPPPTSPPTNNSPTNPPAKSPPSSSPITPPPAAATPPTSTPSAPTTSPPSGASPGANSPAAATVAPSSSNLGTSISIMPIFIVSSILVVGSFYF